MTEVKFECPSCGQNLECSRACGGDVIHCPRCCAEIRVPFSAPNEIEGSVVKAELVAPPPTQSKPGAEESADSRPQKSAASAQPKELICPVCHAELRMPDCSAHPAGTAAVAELVRYGTPTPGNSGEPPHPDLAHMSAEERERHIAHAREANPVQAYPAMKPRLDYVLSGGAHEAGKEAASPKSHQNGLLKKAPPA